jgi:hypothetical protein
MTAKKKHGPKKGTKLSTLDPIEQRIVNYITCAQGPVGQGALRELIRLENPKITQAASKDLIANKLRKPRKLGFIRNVTGRPGGGYVPGLKAPPPLPTTQEVEHMMSTWSTCGEAPRGELKPTPPRCQLSAAQAELQGATRMIRMALHLIESIGG